ncbi:uncharacterized protein LOC117293760 [Asterias rubens]|uniref:uncharacterized protein LOC117293760 n=1 Tax=Asterias rubens TaxID=7604 RepID=UPI001455ACE9|nr:uncharacterized protein LOC117293760 [Asterias rubens]
MSDRAATEALFNDMLQTYRKECLPLYTKGWDKFSTAAKEKLLHMNNFFCGLHLLVSMAETISASLKEFEDQFFDGKHPGAPNVPGVGGFINHSESRTVRLIRTCTKALAKGGDEKSGVHRHWKTFKRRENITKRYLQVFRGNRFNIVFLLGGCVHFLHEKVFYFLDKVQGTTNRLLMAVHADIQQPVFLAGCKVLGLLNKLVTTPLWRVTESDGHIIDLCDQYTKLHNFFSECLEKDTTLFKFMKGEVSPFEDNLVNKDEVYDSLITETQNDEIAMSMARFTFTALKQLLGRVVKDFLPGGQYYDLKVNKEFLQQTLSVPKHNKLPERVFGYLDFLLKKRPNVRSITNEAQVMFTFNKTAKYMDSLTPEQLHREIQEVMVKREGRIEERREKRDL